MENIRIYYFGKSDALPYAVSFLRKLGYKIAETPYANPTHLLLPVPSLEDGVTIKGGYSLAKTISTLPENITVIGGGLNSPLLSRYRQIDLLEDPYYLANNAAISANCALKLAIRTIPGLITEHKVLVVGWGRIGKCLAALLKNLGCKVAVAARKEADRAILSALGYISIPTDGIKADDYYIIFNTVPHEVIRQDASTAILIDLASKPGIICDDVIVARGLPGKEAPESSGRLIASCVDRLLTQEVHI